MKQQFIYSALLMLALTGCGKKQAQKNDTEAPNTDSSASVENKEETGTVNAPLSEEALKTVESQLVKGSPTVFFFFADWCPACRAFKPTVEEVEAKFPDIKVLRMNVDEQKNLVKALKVSSIPTLFLFDKEGKFIESTNGGLSAEKLTEEFKKISSPTNTETTKAEEPKTEVKTTETKTKTETVNPDTGKTEVKTEAVKTTETKKK
jgi:thioredoxin 1